MNINSINQITNSNFVTKTQAKETKNKPQEQTQTSIMSNSLSEAIGRSQIAFKGSNKLTKSGFEHECVEKGETEKISYDSKTGNFKHEKFSKKGEFLGSTEFINATQTKIITFKQDDGTTKVITEKPGIKTTEVFTESGKPLSEVVEKSYHPPKTTTWDYKKHRKLVTEFDHTRVFDLKTGKEVFSGDLLYAEKSDKAKNVKYTYNVHTGKIIKEKQYDKKNRLVKEVEYNEKTGKITRQTEYGKRDGEYRTFEYDKNTFRRVLDENSTNKGRNVRTKTYDAYTEKILSDHEEIFDGDILVGEIEYYLGTDRKKLVKDYFEETCETSYFGYNGNIERFEVHKDGKPVQETIFDKKTGQKVKSVYTDYDKDRRYTDLYDHKGNVQRKIIQSTINDTVLIEKLFYSNGHTKEIHKWNPLLETCHSEFYTSDGIRTRSTKMNADRKITDETIYYEDGVTKKREYHCYDDGESIVTEYDKAGRTAQITHYDKYGRKKVHTYDNTTSYSTNSTSQSSRTDSRREAELNFLKEILNALSSRKEDDFFQVDEKAWQNLAKILGCKDYTLLQEGDKKEYIRLMKEFHPDVCEDKEKGEIITKILNSLR